MKTKKPEFVMDFTGSYKPRNKDEIVIIKSRSWLDKLKGKLSPFFSFRKGLVYGLINLNLNKKEVKI